MAKRFPPEALEPTSLAQQRKASRPVSLSAPKKLTFPDPVAVQPSAIAHIAAARCGFDEGEMAVMLMARPVMAATRVFDFIQEPTDYTNVEPSLSVLLQQFSTTFVALGGNSAAVIDEWCRLNRVMVRDATLRALLLEELYSRAFIHFQYNHFNILLLAAIVHASAYDVVLADCGAPSLLPSLKQESELYRGSMLLFLVSQGLANGQEIRPVCDQRTESDPEMG